MRRHIPLAVALALALGVTSIGTADALPRASGRTDLGAYRGLGTWVDVFDYVPAFQKAGDHPAVTSGSCADMPRLGVKTVYLQAAQDDDRSPGDTIDPKLLGRMLRAAHAAKLRVVAWYLPHFTDVNAAFRRERALLNFKANGQQFDGDAVDIEWNQGESDATERNAALVDLSKRVRKLARDLSVGGVSPNYWPESPGRRLSSRYDVWLPPLYWTNRSSDSGYKDGFKYTDENIRQVRSHLGDKNAPVHAIGGIADAALLRDYAGFVRAVKKQRAIGWSIYDYNTTVSSAWPQLRKG